jgi:methyl-accepting chemotaxis protein
VVEASVLDGPLRLLTFIPLHGAPEAGYVHLSLGIPKATAFAEANRILARNLAGLGLVAALALVAAWVGGDLFLARRVTSLVAAARRLGAGDLSARTGISDHRGELGQLARAFDDMAEAIARRQRELKAQPSPSEPRKQAAADGAKSGQERVQ